MEPGISGWILRAVCNARVNRCRSAAVPAFLPIRVVPAAAGGEASDRSGVEVVIGAGRRVVIGLGFDVETLRQVVAVLEGRMC
jgi:hypothetical protein